MPDYKTVPVGEVPKPTKARGHREHSLHSKLSKLIGTGEAMCVSMDDYMLHTIRNAAYEVAKDEGVNGHTRVSRDENCVYVWFD